MKRAETFCTLYHNQQRKKKDKESQGHKGDHLHKHGIAKDKEPKSLEHWSAVISPLAFL
jgi:hypothetical protein